MSSRVDGQFHMSLITALVVLSAVMIFMVSIQAAQPSLSALRPLPAALVSGPAFVVVGGSHASNSALPTALQDSGGLESSNGDVPPGRS